MTASKPLPKPTTKSALKLIGKILFWAWAVLTVVLTVINGILGQGVISWINSKWGDADTSTAATATGLGWWLGSLCSSAFIAAVMLAMLCFLIAFGTLLYNLPAIIRNMKNPPSPKQASTPPNTDQSN